MLKSLTDVDHAFGTNDVPTELALIKDVNVEKKSFKRGRPTYTVELLPAKNIFESTVLPEGSRRTNNK